MDYKPGQYMAYHKAPESKGKYHIVDFGSGDFTPPDTGFYCKVCEESIPVEDLTSCKISRPTFLELETGRKGRIMKEKDLEKIISKS